MRPSAIAIALGLSCASLAGPAAVSLESEARASISIAVTWDRLLHASSSAVVATPIEASSVWENGRIRTYTHLRVDRGVAGDVATGSEVWVRTLGGVVGKIGQLVDGEAKLTAGQPSLLFLCQAGAGALEVTARGQGQFPIIAADAHSAPRVVRSGAAGALLAPWVSTSSASNRLAADVLHDRPVDDVAADVAAGGRGALHARSSARRISVILAALASLVPARDAAAFCRTTTCGLPPDFSPSPTNCEPASFFDGSGHFWADFASFCAAQNPPEQILPIWWRNSCVSYDLQKDASKQVSYAVASGIVQAAFAQWTNATCAPDTAGATQVSIQVSDLGPVDCNQVQYSSDQGNQHVIIFCDDTFPCDSMNTANEAASSGNTLGLTTVTFDSDTGEIYDADTEINSTVPLSTTAPVPDGSYDLASIITHEMGHFLGLAHSGDDTATMFARYTPGTTSMATLKSDDLSGICSIYIPDGTRAVAASVASSGFLTADACDPTPRHGFQSVCAQPVSNGCDLSAEPRDD